MSTLNTNDNQNNTDVLKKYKRQETLFKIGRTALFVVFGFTVMNMIFMLMGSNRLLVYSAQLPLYFTSMAYSNIADEGEWIFTLLYILAGAALVSPYLILGLLTKNKKKLIVASVVCMFIDCFFMFMFGFFYYPVLQIVLTIAFFALFIAAGFAEEKMRELNTPRKRKKAVKAQTVKKDR